jgi:hypothetical protein
LACGVGRFSGCAVVVVIIVVGWFVCVSVENKRGCGFLRDFRIIVVVVSDDCVIIY